jgi:putative exosortase-associated protein (TIGR04073 family)
MRSISKTIMVGIITFVMFSAVDSFAGDPIRKLGRGVCNTAFGALEIPVQIFNVQREDGALAAVTYGVFRGIAFTVAREVVGVVEIVTFPIPFPDCPDDPRDAGWGYGPLMRPEWIMTTENNWFSIFYDDAPATGGFHGD